MFANVFSQNILYFRNVVLIYLSDRDNLEIPLSLYVTCMAHESSYISSHLSNIEFNIKSTMKTISRTLESQKMMCK